MLTAPVRRSVRTLFLALCLSPFAAATAQAAEVVVYKSPTCGCCQAWVEHLQANGFEVEVHDSRAMQSIKDHLGVPDTLRSCHTAEVGGYVIEGHVPATEVRRLLAEKPAAAGLAVPGMPVGSPGMEQGDRRDPYSVLLFGADGQSVFANY